MSHCLCFWLLCWPLLREGYYAAGVILVDGDVVEGVEVVGKSRVYCQVGHRQDVQVGHPKYLDLHLEGSSSEIFSPDFELFLAQVVIAYVWMQIPPLWEGYLCTFGCHMRDREYRGVRRSRWRYRRRRGTGSCRWKWWWHPPGRPSWRDWSTRWGWRRCNFCCRLLWSGGCWLGRSLGTDVVGLGQICQQE